MAQDQQERQELAAATPPPQDDTPQTDAPQTQQPLSRKEQLYSKIKLPLWAVDAIIAACLVGIVACIVIGRD